MPEDNVVLSNAATETIDKASESFGGLLVDLATQHALKDGRTRVETFDVEAVFDEAFHTARQRSAGMKGLMQGHVDIHGAVR